MKKPKEDCVTMGGLMGTYFGAIGGGAAGWGMGGPIGLVLGIILGASAGMIVGLGIGWVVCFLRENFGGGGRRAVSFAKPYFTNLRLVPTPDPAKKGKPCRIDLRWTVEGNNDNALCEITYLITAEAGSPDQSPNVHPIRNNASSFGRAVALQTKWGQAHDGRLVTANIVLTATKGTEFYRLEAQPAPIRVPVMP
jgi:hypothetical protein